MENKRDTERQHPLDPKDDLQFKLEDERLKAYEFMINKLSTLLDEKLGEYKSNKAEIHLIKNQILALTIGLTTVFMLIGYIFHLISKP
jgi:hypothetical protein